MKDEKHSSKYQNISIYSRETVNYGSVIGWMGPKKEE
jgi:hypothetical protein